MNLGNYYKGALPPPIKKKNKILIFAKKCLLFCVFRIIDFIFWIKDKIKKSFKSDIFVVFKSWLICTYALILILPTKMLGIETEYHNHLNKITDKWLKK